MKKQPYWLLMAMLALFASSCTMVTPDPGTETVLYSKPLFFGHGEVFDQPVSTGRTYCALTTSEENFNIQPFTITENFENMIPSDNTPVSFAAYLKVQVVAGKTPILFKNFGIKWYENNLRVTFRTLVRDKACVYTMFDLACRREISILMQKELFAETKRYADSVGLPITIMEVKIGAVTPPKEFLDETRITAAQNQGLLTQKARAAAELARKQAETNKALADQAYQKQMDMTIPEYLSLRQLEIEKEKVELIKDNKNISIIFGNASPVVPLKGN